MEWWGNLGCSPECCSSMSNTAPVAAASRKPTESDYTRRQVLRKAVEKINSRVESIKSLLQETPEGATAQKYAPSLEGGGHVSSNGGILVAGRVCLDYTRYERGTRLRG